MPSKELKLSPIQSIYNQVSEFYDRCEQEAELIGENLLNTILTIIGDKNNYVENEDLRQSDIDKGISLFKSILEVCKLSHFDYTFSAGFFLENFVRFAYMDSDLSDLHVRMKLPEQYRDLIPEELFRMEFLQYQRPFKAALKDSTIKDLNVLFGIWGGMANCFSDLSLHRAHEEDNSLPERRTLGSIHRTTKCKGITDKAWKNVILKKVS